MDASTNLLTSALNIDHAKSESIKSRVTIVHERFTEPGGSEAVVDSIASYCERASLFAPIIDPEVLSERLHKLSPSASRLQHLYRPGGAYAHLLPFLPVAMKRARIDADVIVTSHHAFSNRINPRNSIPIVSYVHTPARWIWQPDMLRGEGDKLSESLLAAFAATQRRADRAAAQKITTLIANSSAVAQRIRDWWGRESIVIPPPVDTATYVPSPSPSRRDDYFVVAGRLVPYKRPDVAIAAAERAGVRLVVVGDGRFRQHCEEIAGKNTEFLGRVSNAELRSVLQRARALIFPGEEDFGIVPVEAQACGTPVIGLKAGGLLDTVKDQRTGVLVEPAQCEADAFADVLRSFPKAWDHNNIRQHAETFSYEQFRRRIVPVIKAAANE